MATRKQSDADLIKAVEAVTSTTSDREVESLGLQVCTRIRNSDPLPTTTSGYKTWDHVILEILGNVKR